VVIGVKSSSTGRSTSTDRSSTCCSPLCPPGRRRSPPVLPPRAGHVEGDARRGHHRRRPIYPAVLDELVPSAWHRVEQYANNPIEADHGRLKHRPRPMRGLRTDRSSRSDHFRIRLHAEPTMRTLRTRDRPPADGPGRSRMHRTCPGDLTTSPPGHSDVHRSGNASAPPHRSRSTLPARDASHG
jgi:hypothetical protein